MVYSIYGILYSYQEEWNRAIPVIGDLENFY